jgi:chromosome segregation ATPase
MTGTTETERCILVASNEAKLTWIPISNANPSLWLSNRDATSLPDEHQGQSENTETSVLGLDKSEPEVHFEKARGLDARFSNKLQELETTLQRHAKFAEQESKLLDKVASLEVQGTDLKDKVSDLIAEESHLDKAIQHKRQELDEINSHREQIADETETITSGIDDLRTEEHRLHQSIKVSRDSLGTMEAMALYAIKSRTKLQVRTLPKEVLLLSEQQVEEQKYCQILKHMI